MNDIVFAIVFIIGIALVGMALAFILPVVASLVVGWLIGCGIYKVIEFIFSDL